MSSGYGEIRGWRAAIATPRYDDRPLGSEVGTIVPQSDDAQMLTAHNVDTVRVPSALNIGMLPVLALLGTIGVLLVSGAYSGARAAAPAWWVEPVYWLGLLLLFVPIAARLFTARASRAERVGLVLILGLGLYLVKVLRSPQGFELHDEFSHYRTVENILHSGALFGDNPLQPISAVFPGMEIITSALVQVTGMSVYSAGLLELAVARIVLLLALFLAYERVSTSARVAGIACLFYMANQKFLFFDAQFSYESLGLPLAAFALVTLAQRAYPSRAINERAGLTIVTMLGLMALVITHHLTSYAFVFLLLAWAVIAFLITRRDDTRRGEWRYAALVAAVGLFLTLGWAIVVAPSVAGYLLPHLQQGMDQLLSILAGHSSGRQLFRDNAGQVPPTWERIAQLAATGLILVAICCGLRVVWRHYRSHPLVLALAAVALIYPLSLPFRFTEAGAEAADRAAGFAFIGAGFVAAVAVQRVLMWERWRAKSWALAAFTALAGVVFVGEIIVGVGPAWARLPGTYLVSADSRSIDAQSLDVASWMRAVLGPNHRVAADRVNGFLLGSYGEQYPVSHVDSGIDIAPVFFGRGYGPVQRAIIRQGKIQYLVVDLRDSTGLPLEGVYIDASEPQALAHTSPIPPAALLKFTRLIGVSQLYDGGALRIYSIGVTAHEP